MIRVEFIIEEVKKNFPQSDLEVIWRAYVFASRCHKGQMRVSGEPYLSHPLEVANILARMKLGEICVAAGLLHDTLEDTLTANEDIIENFGDEIFQIVDGVTKLSRIESVSAVENQAESIRKMILAMSKDIRVILVKLADRVHNVKTLHYLSQDKIARIARETLDIYAPIANRLGISWIKQNLEDGAFKHLDPERYSYIEEHVKGMQASSDVYIKEMVSKIKEKMTDLLPDIKVYGRSKHYYSINQKMKKQKLSLDDIYDIFGIRIIVSDESSCYKALGLLHSIYKPIPGKLKDYIALPKANMYQSLHTTLLGDGGNPVEVQIRSEKMHTFCEEGIAAHWRYKEGGPKDGKHDEKIRWLRRLLEWQQEVKDPKEFLEKVKIDLFPDEVYIFTPTQEVRSLIRGSTAIDFAYAIHTDIGHHCVGAKINGRLVSLRRELRSGDIVEILTSKKAHPSRDWLKYVATSKARTEIVGYLKQEERTNAYKLGRELLLKISRDNDLDEKVVISENFLSKLSKNTGYNGLESMLVALGIGKLSLSSIAGKIVNLARTDLEKKNLKDQIKITALAQDSDSLEKRAVSSILVGGVDDLMTKFARCCNPTQGEEIVGFISNGRGLIIHAVDCQNLKSIALNAERMVDVSWSQNGAKRSKIVLFIKTENYPGILHRVSSIIYDRGVNVIRADIETNEGDGSGVIYLTLDVTDINQLNDIIDKVSSAKGVTSVERKRSMERAS